MRNEGMQGMGGMDSATISMRIFHYLNGMVVTSY